MIQKVKEGGSRDELMRPGLLEDGEGTKEEKNELNSMICKCWEEDPSQRPDFHVLKNMIRKMK